MRVCAHTLIAYHSITESFNVVFVVFVFVVFVFVVFAVFILYQIVIIIVPSGRGFVNP